MATNEFHQFLSRAALVMERALTDPSDIMFDCYLDDGDKEHGSDKCLGAQVMCRNIFCDEKLCKGRIAMDTHWSPHVSEDIAVYYFHLLLSIMSCCWGHSMVGRAVSLMD